MAAINKMLALAATLASMVVHEAGGQMPRPLTFDEAPDSGRQYPEFMIHGGGTGFAGMATYYNGRPVIFYDIVWVDRMGGLDSPMFRFLRAHEYGHHRRRHGLQQFSAPPGMLIMLGYQSELEADCWAIRILKRNGDTEAINAAFRLYAATVPPHDSQGRPGTIARHEQMRRCLQ